MELKSGKRVGGTVILDTDNDIADKEIRVLSNDFSIRVVI